MQLNTAQDFIDAAKRRKWWIVIPLFLSLVITYGVYKRLPRIYKTSTLILVQPQEVPEAYIKPTVRSMVADRLSTLSQQILSRTRLENVIQEFNLYPEVTGRSGMEQIVAAMRQAITIEVQRTRGRDVQNTFTIGYEGEDPRQVMMVANRLASLFIEENLRARERQATGTAEFLERELASIQTSLETKDQEIRAFKEKYMGELPQQLDANLRILGRLQDQMKNNADAFRATEERRIMVQQEIAQLSDQGSLLSGQQSVSRDSPVVQLSRLRSRLTEIRSMYTEQHPDVVDLKMQIDSLEKEIEEGAGTEQDSDSAAKPRVFNPAVARLRGNLAELGLETSRVKAEERRLIEQIAMYQSRVENTPRIEQELATLTRDYGLLKANYQSLLDKKIQARMAENLERRQMGEQFTVLDPARLPEKPYKPDPRRVMLIGAFLGLVFGCGLAYMRETGDRSFHRIEEIEKALGFPVIATIPRIGAAKLQLQ
jgi:polysaccharide chain length determinant protein (PEP-CTERM system associated)